MLPTRSAPTRPRTPRRLRVGPRLALALAPGLAACASSPPPRPSAPASALPPGQSRVEVSVRNLAGPALQFDTVAVAVDDLPALTLAAGPAGPPPAGTRAPLAFSVAPGEHRVTVRGAFRHCASVGCNGAWVLYREASYALRVPERCVGAVRADVYEPPDPAGWHESAGWRNPNGGVRIPPQIDFAARTYYAAR